MVKAVIFATLFVTLLVFINSWLIKKPTSLPSRASQTSEITTTTNIIYRQIDNQDLQLDLFQPPDNNSSNHPAIIWIHSGGFYTGKKEDINGLAAEFAKRGFVSTSINYRLTNTDYLTKDFNLSQIKKTPAIINAQDDATAAVVWLKNNATLYHVDPNQIFVAGGSAGAITALLVGYNQESVKIAGVIAIMGVADPTMVKVGGPPVIMFNGGLDTLIKPEWVNLFQKQIEDKNIAHEFYWYPNANHGQVPLEDQINKTNLFLNKYLKQNSVLNYQISFTGVKPNNSQCAVNWPLQFTVLSNGQSQTYSNIIPQTSAIINNQLVFSGSLNLINFNQSTNITTFIKGPKHLQIKYDTSHNLFIPGDINDDNIINGIDFAYIKSKSLIHETVESGGYLTADLDGNCQVNSNDVNLAKFALQDRQDQLY